MYSAHRLTLEIILDATGSTNSGTPQVQRTQYPQVIHDYNGGMQHTG